MPGDENVGAIFGSLPGRSRLVHSGKVAAETLDLWLLDTAVDDIGVDPSSLDDGERQRASALETPGLQRRHTLAHAALRDLLGQALGLSPRDVRIVREDCPRCGAAARGRPVLSEATRQIHFSLSASEHLVLIGLASAEVGVDVEAVPSSRAVSQASELLHAAEREELLAVAPDLRRVVFTRLWSRKEAYLKGVGVGLGHGLVGEYFGTAQEVTPDGWTLLDVPVPPGFFASAAVRTRSPRRSRPGRRMS